MGDRFSIMPTPRGPPGAGSDGKGDVQAREAGERQRVASCGNRPDSTLSCEGGELDWRFGGLRHHDLVASSDGGVTPEWSRPPAGAVPQPHRLGRLGHGTRRLPEGSATQPAGRVPRALWPPERGCVTVDRCGVAGSGGRCLAGLCDASRASTAQRFGSFGGLWLGSSITPRPARRRREALPRR
jgi:hypothetical protein